MADHPPALIPATLPQFALLPIPHPSHYQPIRPHSPQGPPLHLHDPPPFPPPLNEFRSYLSPPSPPHLVDSAAHVFWHSGAGVPAPAPPPEPLDSSSLPSQQSQIPSPTRDGVRTAPGRLATTTGQWKLDPAQAEVPGSSLPSRQSQKSSLTSARASVADPSRHAKESPA